MKHEFLEFDSYYHIYNRANGSEKLFHSQENYRYFLARYIEYMSPLFDTYCYCLMPNHFHLLVKIKTRSEITAHYYHTREETQSTQSKESITLTERDLAIFLSKQFSNFFNGYTLAINKMYNRKGSLFMRPFKRKKVERSTYFYNLVLYIHQNPIEAKLASNLTDWPYSSYSSLISNQSTFLKRNDLLNWFSDKEHFIFYHTPQQARENVGFQPTFE